MEVSLLDMQEDSIAEFNRKMELKEAKKEKEGFAAHSSALALGDATNRAQPIMNIPHRDNRLLGYALSKHDPKKPYLLQKFIDNPALLMAKAVRPQDILFLNPSTVQAVHHSTDLAGGIPDVEKVFPEAALDLDLDEPDNNIPHLTLNNYTLLQSSSNHLKPPKSSTATMNNNTSKANLVTDFSKFVPVDIDLHNSLKATSTMNPDLTAAGAFGTAKAAQSEDKHHVADMDAGIHETHAIGINSLAFNEEDSHQVIGVTNAFLEKISSECPRRQIGRAHV